MAKTTTVKKYEWDIAISLCKEDIDFANKLVKAINPTLKVFFYEDSQPLIEIRKKPDHNNEGITICNRPVAGETQGNENRYKKSPEFMLRVWGNR